MTEGQGYLTALESNGSSGLARITFRDTLKVSRRTKFTRAHVESGFGVRQIVSCLGVGGKLVEDSSKVLVAYVIDDLGLLEAIQPLDSEEWN